jgi:hypothetical protein
MGLQCGMCSSTIFFVRSCEESFEILSFSLGKCANVQMLQVNLVVLNSNYYGRLGYALTSKDFNFGEWMNESSSSCITKPHWIYSLQFYSLPWDSLIPTQAWLLPLFKALHIILI